MADYEARIRELAAEVRVKFAQRRNKWAHLGSNQGPLACEGEAAFAVCRRLTPKRDGYAESAFVGRCGFAA